MPIKNSLLRIKQLGKKLLTDSVVQIEPTRRCNFNCLHCNHKENEGNLKLSVYRSILARHSACKIVKLQGLGEALLHPEIQTLIDIAKGLGHQVTIITNGSCRYVSNVDHYVFSLETMSAAVYEALGKRNLPRVLENIRYAASKQKVTINCVLCSDTTPQDVSEVKAFAKEIKADIWLTPQEVWVDPLHQDHDDQAERAKVARQIHGIAPGQKKYQVCVWGVSEFYYDYTGASHPCCIRMNDEYRNAQPCKAICESCPL